jgi:sorting nexin-13
MAQSKSSKDQTQAEMSHVSLMCFTGWRVSAEQQISDMELQNLKAGGERHQPKGQLPNPTLENMKEAAYSIYEQYLSEKVNSLLYL